MFEMPAKIEIVCNYSCERRGVRRLFYYRFWKNAIFQNFGNICSSSVGLLFFFFFHKAVEAIARLIYTKFGTNVSSRVGFRSRQKF